MSTLIVEVVRINDIVKHDNADKLEIAVVKGWNCVVQKEQFKIGDLAVYIPIDSVVPQELIDKYNLTYLKHGERVRTVKLRGVISQGLLLTLPDGVDWKEGKDVTDILKITKYEPPVPGYQSQSSLPRSTAKRLNPLFVKYTDIENIKNYNNVFKEGELVVITCKVHGSNMRASNLPRYNKTMWDKIKSLFFGKVEFLVGSRNVQFTFKNKRDFYYKKFNGKNIYVEMAKKYKLDEILPKGYIIYGEIYGSKIQELTYGKKDGEIDVVFFDLMIDGKYADFEVFKDFCDKHNLPIVPVLYIGEFNKDVLAECTVGNSVLSTVKQIREGCVVKPLKEIYDHSVGRKILKSINPEYLLKKDRTEYH
jgi:RNA ligase (TIGR02306 family)